MAEGQSELQPSTEEEAVEQEKRRLELLEATESAELIASHPSISQTWIPVLVNVDNGSPVFCR